MAQSRPAKVSSPAATGAAGAFFEQHVDAYWLAQLLVRGIPPILCDCAVVEVHLQTERLGWHTDDFLIVGERAAGERWMLAGQVKRTFTVSATDDDCKKTVQDFWKDFRNPQQFSPDIDRFALVTLRGTNTLLEHFAGLLDCARAAHDGAEFESRLATRGFLSAKAIEYCSEIRTIVGEVEGTSVSAADVWPFLRVLFVLSLDLNTSTRQTEAAIKTLLTHTAGEQEPLGAAEASWNALHREVGEGMPQARTSSGCEGAGIRPLYARGVGTEVPCVRRAAPRAQRSRAAACRLPAPPARRPERVLAATPGFSSSISVRSASVPAAVSAPAVRSTPRTPRTSGFDDPRLPKLRTLWPVGLASDCS
jgi:hypothetical protein